MTNFVSITGPQMIDRATAKARVQAARAFQQALSDEDYYVDSNGDRDPNPIAKGTPVHAAWERFRLTFCDGRMPHTLNRACLRLQRLANAKDFEAFEAAEELDLQLSEYSGDEYRPKPDGLLDEGGIRWHGKEHKCIEPKPAMLLRLLWTKNSVNIDRVIEELGDGDTSCDQDPYMALNPVISKVKKFLLKADVPWYYRKKGNFIVRADW